jgi:hypothetical protein
VSSSVVAIRCSSSLLGHEQLPNQVLEDDEHEPEQGDTDRAQAHGDVHGDERQQRREQLGGQDRRERLARLVNERRPVEVALVAGDKKKVQRHGNNERGKHQQVIRHRVRSDICKPNDAVEERAGYKREPHETREVVAEVVRRLAPADPPDRDR